MEVSVLPTQMVIKYLQLLRCCSCKFYRCTPAFIAASMLFSILSSSSLFLLHLSSDVKQHMIEHPGCVRLGTLLPTSSRSNASYMKRFSTGSTHIVKLLCIIRRSQLSVLLPHDEAIFYDLFIYRKYIHIYMRVTKAR